MDNVADMSASPASAASPTPMIGERSPLTIASADAPLTLPSAMRTSSNALVSPTSLARSLLFTRTSSLSQTFSGSLTSPLSKIQSQSLQSPSHSFEQAVFNRALDAADRAYVKELTTYSLSRLEREPKLLNDRQSMIDREIMDVSVTNYKTFIDTGVTVHDSNDTLINIEATLSMIEDTVPSLYHKCQDFLAKSVAHRQQQSLNKLMIENQLTLLELLELPQLMESCARGSLFEESLDLYSYTSDLYRRHSHIAVLGILIEEMKATLASIQSSLLTMLASNIQLSHCLRVVSHLRRMDGFDEFSLRQRFLECREKYLIKLIDTINTNTGTNAGTGGGSSISQSLNVSQRYYDYLNRFMDFHRVHLFDIITQYRAIFIDDTSTIDSDYDDRGLLQRWCHHRINTFITTVNDTIINIEEGTYLYNLLEQSLYCGSSLARVGLDFRLLLIQSFQSSVTSIFTASANDSVKVFQSSLTDYQWFIPVRELQKLGLPTDRHTVLIQFPPLIVTTNAFIAAYNRIRHVALIGCQTSVVSLTSSALVAMSDIVKNLALTSDPSSTSILHYQPHFPRTTSSRQHSRSSSNGTVDGGEDEDESRDPIARLSYAFVTEFVPHINSLLQSLYDNDANVDSSKIESQLAPLYEAQLRERNKRKERKLAEEQQQKQAAAGPAVSHPASASASPATSGAATPTTIEPNGTSESDDADAVGDDVVSNNLAIVE